MKKAISIIILVSYIMCLFSFCVNASLSNDKNKYDCNISDGKASLKYYDVNSSGKKFDIPKFVDEYPVNRIAANGMNNSNFNEVHIPESVSYIDKYIFKNCTNLQKITIDGEPCSIGIDAFYNTKYYNEINNWKNGALYIGTNLIRVSPLVSGTFTIKEGTTLIADNCFTDCEKIDNVIIPKSVKYIGTDAFENTGIIKNKNNWENDALYIDNCLLKLETSSETYSIKNNTRVIADYSIIGKNLKKLTFPEGVRYLGKSAITSKNITEVVFPSSLEYIGNNNFNFCNIKSFTIPDGNKFFATSNGMLYTKDMTTIIKCPQQATGVIKLPNTVKQIGNHAFFNCFDLENVIIPESVVGIGNNAFEMSKIKSIKLPLKLKSIGQWAFSCCGIEEIDIPDSTEYLGENAFNGSSYLKSAKLGLGVTKIPNDVFYFCKNLNHLEIKGDITDFSRNALYKVKLFEDENNYTEDGLLIISQKYLIGVKTNKMGIYHIPEGVEQIIDYGDNNLINSINTLYIPSSLKSVEGYLFDTQIERCIYNGTKEDWDNIKNHDKIEKYCENILTYNELPVIGSVVTIIISVLIVVLMIICVKKSKTEP